MFICCLLQINLSSHRPLKIYFRLVSWLSHSLETECQLEMPKESNKQWLLTAKQTVYLFWVINLKRKSLASKCSLKGRWLTNYIHHKFKKLTLNAVFITTINKLRQIYRFAVYITCSHEKLFILSVFSLVNVPLITSPPWDSLNNLSYSLFCNIHRTQEISV